MAKYLKVATVKEWDGSEYLEIDNSGLREFVDLLNDHGAKNLKGLSREDIWAGERAKEIRSIRAYRYDPHEKAPDFVKGDFVVKISD